ncbi:MAG: response regulator [Acidobacteria bacterium]|nr:response regulator [Acidobacteriota bacterium]
MSFKLLLVDDEVPVLEVLKAALGPLGAEVTALADSREAAERLDREKFDGIVVDARMPDPDGFELTRRIRASKLNRAAPVVMLTGFDDVDTMRQGFRAGVTCFLGKPPSRDRIMGLFSALRGAMLNQRRRHARLPFRTAVNCSWGSERPRHFTAESLNIGEGGMLIQPRAGLEVGDDVNLEFSIPTSAKALRMRAKVLRIDDSGCVGVDFVGSSILDLEAIQAYIMGVLKG